MYAVYRDAQSHCCLVVFDDDLTVKYIALTEESGQLKVDQFTVEATAFHREYKKLEEYPVKRAAQHFLKPLTSAIVVSSAAQRHLNHIMENKMSTTETITKVAAKKSPVVHTTTNKAFKASPKPTPKIDTTKPKKPAASHDAGQGNVTATNKASVKTTTKAAHAPVVAPAKFKKPTAKQLADAKKKLAAEKTAAKETEKKAKQQAKDDAAAIKAAAKGKAPPKVVKAAKVAKKAAKAAKKPTPAKKFAKLVRNPKHEAPAAKKAAKPAKGEKKAGRPGAFTDDMVITVLVKDNPKREGTGAHEIFELLRKSKTVGEFYKKGGASSNLRWNIDHEFIKVK